MTARRDLYDTNRGFGVLRYTLYYVSQRNSDSNGSWTNLGCLDQGWEQGVCESEMTEEVGLELDFDAILRE